MRHLICLSLVALCSCDSINDYYQGKVMDENGKALAGVTVSELYRNRQTETDATGYFKLDRSPEWLGELIFTKNGYHTDTIPSVWHQAGETTEYRFVKNDTALIRLRVSAVK